MSENKTVIKPKYYLAAAFPRKAEIAHYANRMRDAGLTVVSTWHDESKDKTIDVQQFSPALIDIVTRDMRQLNKANIIVGFTSDAARLDFHKGGMNWELGYMAGRQQGAVLIGPRVNLFHWLYANRFELFTDFLREAKKKAETGKLDIEVS